MSQSRPSRPSKHHVEHPSAHTDPPRPTPAAGSADSPAPSASSAPAGSPASPEAASADQALTPPGATTAPSGSTAPRRAPSQQSRPGPQDDIMLATGKPRQTERPKPPTQEQIRRQPGRKAWVPNQHGAWSMLVLPPIVGWIVGGFSWVNLLFLPAWWGGYLTYWSWSQWLRTRSARKRALIMLPLLVYTGWTASLALITLMVAPYLIQWAVPLAPLFAIALHQVWRGHERSLLSGLSTTTAASLMAAVTYSLAVRGDGGFLGLGTPSSPLPGTSPGGVLTGWSWMWLVTALTAAYFGGTVPYIKSMIRERFNYTLLAGTVAAHAVVAAATWWLASSGMLPWGHAVLWVVLTVRSLVMPLWQWQLVRARHRPLRPGTMGIVEVFMCVAFLVTISV
ncbi:YwiC-like family protein [Actinomyces oris]|uniref:YwiC-like family protein n=1 Tax=Actinomyces oris TaxID=544580 RepID=UPI000A4E3AB4|nr:YwiC-like family protein [Actinomyces oris]